MLQRSDWDEESWRPTNNSSSMCTLCRFTANQSVKAIYWAFGLVNTGIPFFFSFLLVHHRRNDDIFAPFPFYSSTTEVTSTSTFLHRPPPATETWGNKQYLYADLGWVFFFFKQKITGFQYIAQWSPHPKTSRGLSLASLRSLTGEDDLLGSFRDSLTPKVFFAQDFERHTLVDHKPLVLCSRGNSTSGLFSICIYKTLYLQMWQNLQRNKRYTLENAKIPPELPNNLP